MIASAAFGAKRAIEKTFIRDLPNHVGERLIVHGWFVSLRRTKALRFLEIRDRTGTVQAVCRSEQQIESSDLLTPESALRIVGTVRESVVTRFGTIEINVEAIDALAGAQQLPLLDGGDANTVLDYRYLNLRSRAQSLIFEVQTTLESAVREFLLSRDFIEIHTPKITAGGSESGAAVFQLPYFGQLACLAQSPQFYMQMAMTAGFDRVFEVGPVFRAEEAITNRHATEFTCIDVELSWIDSHNELMDFEEELLRFSLSKVRDAHGADIERHCGVEVEVPEDAIPRIPVSMAKTLTKGAFSETGGRLTQTAEQMLSKYAQERYGQSFVFLTNYPTSDRPFYTMQEDGGSEVAPFVESRSFDLLWRGIEVTSGCQREHRYDRLQAQIAEGSGESGARASYLGTYYLEMFKYGCPPHGGFGIGVNRLLMAMLGQQSIRETSFVFRGPGRFVP